MKFTISTSLLHGHLEAKFQQAAEAGFDAIDLHTLDVTTSKLRLSAIAALAAGYQLPIGKYQPIYNLEGLEGVDRIRAFDVYKSRLDQALELDAGMLLVGSSTTTLHEISFESLSADLHEVAEMAASCGLKIAYLAMPWASRVQSSKEAYQMVEAVGHSAFGLALSSYFELADGSKPAKLRDFDGKRIFSVQLADAPFSHFDISQFKHEFACLPGLGNLNLVSFIRVLSACGYNQPWSLARMGQQIGAGKNRAMSGYRALVDVLDRSCEVLPNKQKNTVSMPDRAILKGYEFLEFALDDNAAGEMRQLLKTLCFRNERTHCSKSVELWRQGAINILLNTSTTGFAKDFFERSGPSLCEMGLRVANAKKTVERAEALGVKTISQQIDGAELCIPAIEGVGHSRIRFVDEESNLHHLWDIDFETVHSAEAIAPAGLRRLDHLAQTMTSENIDSWLLLYLSVFDVQKTPPVDVTDPEGIVYSRAIESPEGGVRLNLNGTHSDQTFSGAFLSERNESSVQHIAISTDDIFETSARLHETQFARLPIPANYYDELKIQYGLSNDMLNTLRADNILYSKNTTGEFFQLYSQPIWGGFFIEIVERRGGHSGYGAGNAPIRLAAQKEIMA